MMSPFNQAMMLGCGDPCSGSPTVTSCSAAEDSGNCSGGAPESRGFIVNITYSLSSTPAGFEVEVWRATVNNPGDNDFVYWRRNAITETTEKEQDLMWGTDGGGASTTLYRTYKIRVVPASSGNGEGPFCDTDTTNQITRTLNDCVD
jgi:hypothetical protein